MINLARLINKDAEGLYPKLMLRGEEIIRQGLDANHDEHEIWLDYHALVSEVIINPNFDVRRKFLDTAQKFKQGK